MRQRIVWTGLTAGLALFIFMLAGSGRALLHPWVYGAAYFLFGLVLLGAVARWWTRGSPALWRPFMLSVGSLCAALEISLRSQAAAGLPPVDRWMVALLGLLVAAIAARFIPERLTRLWFGIDRRVHEPGG